MSAAFTRSSQVLADLMLALLVPACSDDTGLLLASRPKALLATKAITFTPQSSTLPYYEELATRLCAWRRQSAGEPSDPD